MDFQPDLVLEGGHLMCHRIALRARLRHAPASAPPSKNGTLMLIEPTTRKVWREQLFGPAHRVPVGSR